MVGAPTSLVESTFVMKNGNTCSSPVEIGATTKSDESTRQFIKKETVRKVKSIGGHVGLLITLMLYTAIGGLRKGVELDKTCDEMKMRARCQWYFVSTNVRLCARILVWEPSRFPVWS
ncbi:PREDICTED: uncharacterized protein LOC105556414 [Vollenhovia emeryi]|uniref:uncharacterized protein LOC105556414 n=1 Tax=Vollenhovia emeryi TaxID=411798 RepID=UPI0005F50A84|nr:PREDICTED: uncharacterized protein LOC105556414 [Vollenhovia emeryi]XP_011858896.1 PREDICTED: uncharacterized protein LOC105556414 [Vollenhovia emeryi]